MDNITFHDHKPEALSLYDAVVDGLSRDDKSIPPKFFYDERGSELFECICRQPEYYPPNVEQHMLSQLADEIASLKVKYTLSPGGQLAIDYRFSPSRDSLPNIPRLGMFLTLPDDFNETAWYGKGPHETYWDRNSSGKIGIHNGIVNEQFHRYSRPQETGNKMDLRWMSVSSDALQLTVHPSDNQLINGSVWPFNTAELDYVEGKDGGQSASGLVPVSARHGAEIKIGPTVQWNIDHLQMGLGGDTSWGRLVHKEYTIPPAECRYSIVIVPESL